MARSAKSKINKTSNMNLNVKKGLVLLNFQSISLKYGSQALLAANIILLQGLQPWSVYVFVNMQIDSSPVIFLYHASPMQVPSLSHPVSKAALFLSIFTRIVLVYLLLKATVQGSAEIIREARSVSSLSDPLSVVWLLSPALFFCPLARLGVWEAGR